MKLPEPEDEDNFDMLNRGYLNKSADKVAHVMCTYIYIYMNDDYIIYSWYINGIEWDI
jgi:hypothetical protein